MDTSQVCSFTGCKSSFLNRKDCSFFEFPKDFNLCLQWIESIGNKQFYEDFAYGGAVPFKKRYICSEHFGDDDFIDPSRVFSGIKSTAIPSHSPLKLPTSFGPYIIKREPSEDFWHSGQVDNPGDFSIALLENVKVEVVTPESINKGIEYASTDHGLMSRRKRKAEAMARRRASENDEERTRRLKKNADRMALRRSTESEEKTNLRRRQNALRNSIRRSLETSDEREKRLKENAERAARRRRNETPEQREIRRINDLFRARKRRQNETEDQINLRKIQDAARAKMRRQNESKEERNLRRLNDLIRISNKRKNETSEERTERLRKNREYSAKKRQVQKTEPEESDNSKNLVINTALTLRSEDVNTMNITFFQSLSMYPRPHEYHFVGDLLPEKDNCHICHYQGKSPRISYIENNYDKSYAQKYLHSKSFPENSNFNNEAENLSNSDSVKSHFVYF